jgi:ABC-2 type transport system ATP-binding protein
LIEVHSLSKFYGKIPAVTDISFSVGKGQVLGFLGPNGAGKTTVMKILTGYHFPTKGIARVNGISVVDDPVKLKKRIGYLPENVPLYGDLTVDESLAFNADVRLIPLNKRKHAIETSLDICGLRSHRSRKIDTLSKGFRQRTGLAQAILHDPPILILDEPTTGLDPNQIIEIRSLIRELGKKKTVILSTHILQEVEVICSEVLIINDGHIAAQGTAEQIAATVKGGDTWELVLRGQDASFITEKLSFFGHDINIGAIENTDEQTVKANFFIPDSGSSDAERIFDWAISNNLKILGMNCKKLSLEDIFVKLTAEERNGKQLTAEERNGKGADQ